MARTSALFVAALLLAGAVACSPATGQPGGARCPGEIVIRDFAFTPASCEVTVGAAVTFVNQDSAPHTATTDPGAVAVFDTGTLEGGATRTVTFGQVGAYPYHCALHPSMSGTITVVAAAASALTSGSEGESTGGGY